MPRLRSLPEQPVMRDLYKSQPASCKPLGELTEVAMRAIRPKNESASQAIRREAIPNLGSFFVRPLG